MKGRISKPMMLALGGAVCFSVFSTTASAEIYTFWKTDTCPNMGGPPVWSQVGLMQAPIFHVEQTLIASGDELGCVECAGIGVGIGVGVGGAHCVLDNTVIAAVTTVGTKLRQVYNAEILVDQTLDPGNPGTCDPLGGDCVWRCVVCRYEKLGGAIPALSALGTAVLMGGLLMAGIYEIRRRQQKAAA